MAGEARKYGREWGPMPTPRGTTPLPSSIPGLLSSKGFASSGFASPEQVAITKKHLQDTIARKKVVTDHNTVAQKAMDATGETGSNTRMGLQRQFKSEHSPSDRGPARGLRGSPEEAAAHEKTMNAAAAEKKAAKKEAVISALQSGQEDNADFLERQRELQAVPKADEFERINLAEVFEL